MDRSRLRNRFLKTRSNEDKKAYDTQRNYCLTLVRKAKKDYYYNNLNHENVTDKKTFWKSMKPCFSEKGSTHNKNTLVEQNLILDKNDNVAEVFNKFFYQCSFKSEYSKTSRQVSKYRSY